MDNSSQCYGHLSAPSADHGASRKKAEQFDRLQVVDLLKLLLISKVVIAAAVSLCSTHFCVLEEDASSPFGSRRAVVRDVESDLAFGLPPATRWNTQ